MRPPILFFVLDAFTDTRFAGNPAGVFLDDAAWLSPDEMRRLAGEVSLESAFVLPGDAACDLRLRYFTGVAEVPLCGHATVSALVALAHAGRVPGEGALRLRTPVGVLRAALSANGANVTLFQNLPERGAPLDEAASREVLAALGCSRDARLPLQVVSTGSPFLFVPVADRASVEGTDRRDREALARLCRRHEALGVYVFAVEPDGDGIATWGRCFAPAVGLDEDPVTGSASGALGGYLAQHGALTPDPSGTARFTARQGFAGGRGGSVGVEICLIDAQVTSVSITGSAVLVAEGAFRV